MRADKACGPNSTQTKILTLKEFENDLAKPLGDIGSYN